MAKAATARTAAAAVQHKIAEKVLHSNFLRVLSPLLSHALSLCLCVVGGLARALHSFVCLPTLQAVHTHTHTQQHSNKQRILCLLLTFCANYIIQLCHLMIGSGCL